MSVERYSGVDLEQVRDLQRLAYDCAQEVARGLRPGDTERQAAERLGQLLREAGADGFFHTPFAWFGDRSGFRGFTVPSWRRPQDNVIFARQFFPTNRRLEEGMCAILDVAPIRDGLCADIGYSFACGHNAELESALDDLLEMRHLILREVRAERSIREIYRAVDAALCDMGYESAHACYPLSVLAHKVGRIPLAGLPSRAFEGFDLRTYLYFGRQIVTALPGLRGMPVWNAGAGSDARPDPGLWAFEPHVRKGGVDAAGLGAKWEEIMVIDDAGADWLDDALPHVTRARRTEAEAAAR